MFAYDCESLHDQLSLVLLFACAHSRSRQSRTIELYPPPGVDAQYNVTFESESVKSEWFAAIKQACARALYASFDSHTAGSNLTAVRKQASSGGEQRRAARRRSC